MISKVSSYRRRPGHNTIMVVTHGGSDTGPAAGDEPAPIAFPSLGEHPDSEHAPALGEPSEDIGDWREELRALRREVQELREGRTPGIRTPGGTSSTLDKGFKEPEQKLSLTGTAVEQDKWMLTARLYVQAQGWENSHPHFIYFVSKHVDTDLFPLFHAKLQEPEAFRDWNAMEGWIQGLHPRALDVTLDRLEKIRQGHRIVRLYVAEFEGVLAEIPLASRPADCTLQRAFGRGLHPGLVRLLTACPHVQTYTEAKQEVFRLEQYLLAMEGYKGVYGQQEFLGRQPGRSGPGGQQYFAGARFDSQRNPGVPARTFAPPRGNSMPASQKRGSQDSLKRQQPGTAPRPKTNNSASVKAQRRREGGCSKCGSTEH